MNIAADCERTNLVTNAWTSELIDDQGTFLSDVDLSIKGVTAGDSGITFGSGTLTYGLYRFNVDVFMTGHEQYNASTSIYARVLGKLHVKRHIYPCIMQMLCQQKNHYAKM